MLLCRNFASDYRRWILVSPGWLRSSEFGTVGRRADERPVEFIDVSVGVECVSVLERFGLPFGREIGGGDESDPGRYLEAACAADDHQPADAGLARTVTE